MSGGFTLTEKSGDGNPNGKCSQLLVSDSIDFGFFGQQLLSPSHRPVTHCVWTTNKLEAFVKDVLDSMLDRLIKQERQSRDSRKTELKCLSNLPNLWW